MIDISVGVLDDILCSQCGGELDTGYECNDCGYDMRPEIYPEKYVKGTQEAPDTFQ